MATTFAAAKTLERFPRSSDTHLLADHVEILCLSSRDRQLTRAEFIDRARERSDLGGELEEFHEEIRQVTAASELDRETGSPAATINDRWAKLGIDCFAQLAFRQRAFGDAYPFVIEQDTINVRAELSLLQRMYIFLLLASALRHFATADRTRIASIFEVVSLDWLEVYMPDGSEVHMFGKHGLNQGRYSGKLWFKLQRLATDLGESLQCREHQFKPQNTGDAGLDLVAWTAPGDSSPGFLLVFGQCGCTVEWVDKQFETHPDAWSNLLSFTAYPARITFVPFCFRDADGAWYDTLQIRKTILVDRLRLIRLIRSKLDRSDALISRYVEHVLAYVQPIV
jgi:hypothetical protein